MIFFLRQWWIVGGFVTECFFEAGGDVMENIRKGFGACLSLGIRSGNPGGVEENTSPELMEDQ